MPILLILGSCNTASTKSETPSIIQKLIDFDKLPEGDMESFIINNLISSDGSLIGLITPTSTIPDGVLMGQYYLNKNNDSVFALVKFRYVDEENDTIDVDILPNHRIFVETDQKLRNINNAKVTTIRYTYYNEGSWEEQRPVIEKKYDDWSLKMTERFGEPVEAKHVEGCGYIASFVTEWETDEYEISLKCSYESTNLGYRPNVELSIINKFERDLYYSSIH